MTVGTELMTLTPLAAWVAVMSHSIVLFLFASEELEGFLANQSLPTIPLVPVSSSQAVVGAVIGIGMLQGGREIQWSRVYGIVRGWTISPLLSCLICFIGLYFMQNVFQQTVKNQSIYLISDGVIEKFKKEGVDLTSMKDMNRTVFKSSAEVVRSINSKLNLTNEQKRVIVKYSLQKKLFVTTKNLELINKKVLSKSQYDALRKLEGQSFDHGWELRDALGEKSSEWFLKGGVKNKLYDREIKQKLENIYRILEWRRL